MAGGPRADADLLLRLEHAVDDLLATHREPDSALPEILQAIGTTLGWPVASVWMWRGDGLRQVASWSLRLGPEADHFREFVEHGEDFTFAPGVGLPGQVWVARQALWVNDIADSTQFPRAPVAGRSGLR